MVERRWYPHDRLRHILGLGHDGVEGGREAPLGDLVACRDGDAGIATLGLALFHGVHRVAHDGLIDEAEVLSVLLSELRDGSLNDLLDVPPGGRAAWLHVHDFGAPGLYHIVGILCPVVDLHNVAESGVVRISRAVTDELIEFANEAEGVEELRRPPAPLAGLAEVSLRDGVGVLLEVMLPVIRLLSPSGSFRGRIEIDYRGAADPVGVDVDVVIRALVLAAT